ncbi:RNA-directed DNA polymerase [Rhizobium leguminosarum bv. viciae]|uniref:reverse transcriptase family protein n=1 Tax=Rhizobium leguminosarum TaxID=384 RepID=UPI001441A82C|nr:reverse transcriptase family protein [Rhizobium leguminosarum]NKK01236.1 RNA-directed DNA polymerase [Rhizobium leguminosarum bv. viciae]
MWSSHLYRVDARKKGLSEATIEAAISQSEKVINADPSLPSILSLKHLASRCGVPYSELREFVSRRAMFTIAPSMPYNKFSIQKRSGGRRFIYVPNRSLMTVQRWINTHILAQISPHGASHAFTKRSSIKRCALVHCGSAWLVKLDISDFFESVSEIQVYRSFKSMGYTPLVAFELARICTIRTPRHSPRERYGQWRIRELNEEIYAYNEHLLGYLPQGAPSSPLLSNIVMRDCDMLLSQIAAKFGMKYTRYSDDLTFSSLDPQFGREACRNLIFEAYAILSKAGYRPNARKCTVVPPSGKKIVLGLQIDGTEPRLTKDFKDRIRQHLYFLEKFGPLNHAFERKFDSVWGMKAHIKGLIDFAKMVEPGYAEICRRRFNLIDWPV